MIPFAEIIRRFEADYRARYGHQLTPERGKVRIPAQAGHGFQGNLDSDSIGSWTPIPRQAGPLSGVA